MFKFFDVDDLGIIYVFVYFGILLGEFIYVIIFFIFRNCLRIKYILNILLF